MNEESKDDEILFQLALTAQKHPPLSSQRQLALNRLVNRILKSSQLGHPQSGGYPPSFYEDIYNEALQKTLLQICQKIDNYNPINPVMAWVNFLLKMRFRDVVKDFKRKGITYIPSSEQTPSIPSLHDLENKAFYIGLETETKLLEDFLETDPEKLLQKEHIRGRSDITFQKIAQAKYIQDQTWENLATQYNISCQTLHSFFGRKLQKLIPYFKKYLQE